MLSFIQTFLSLLMHVNSFSAAGFHSVYCSSVEVSAYDKPPLDKTCYVQILETVWFKNMKIILILSIIVSSSTVCAGTAPKDKLFSFLNSTFYLKVIDQEGLPVEGIEVDIRHGANHWIGGGNIASEKGISDANGVIAIKVDGRQITFKRMQKDNFHILLPDILFEYYKTRSFQVPAQGDLWPKDFVRFSQSNPFIITAWRVDPKELKATCKNGFIRKIKLNADGRSYGVDILQSVRRQVVKESTPDRNLQVSFKREKVEPPTQISLIKLEIFKKRWQFEMTMRNGGLVEINSEELYQKIPPKFGYLNSWQLDNGAFKPRRNAYGGAQYEDQRHFFMKINDNQYARLSINFAPIGMHLNEIENSEITIDYSVDVNAVGYVRSFDSRRARLSRSRRNTCVNL